MDWGKNEGELIKIRPVPKFEFNTDGVKFKHEEAVRLIIPKASKLDDALPYVFLFIYTASWFLFGLSL